MNEPVASLGAGGEDHRGAVDEDRALRVTGCAAADCSRAGDHRALAAAGLPTDAFTFLGFLPSRPGRRRERLRELRHEPRTLVFYEAPHRLAACLKDLAEVLGDRPAAVARELTKLHEEFARGSLAELAAAFTPRTLKGEVVLLVAPAPPRQAEVADQEAGPLADMLRRSLAAGLTVKDAVRQVVAVSGRPRGEVYAEALRLKEEGLVS